MSLAQTIGYHAEPDLAGAVDYYPRVGFERHPQAWTLPPGRMVTS
jgi:hypothetical protein